LDSGFTERWLITSAAVALVYFVNVYIYIPKYLKQGKYVTYLFILLASIAIAGMITTEFIRTMPMPEPLPPAGIRKRVFISVRPPVLPMIMTLALGISFEMILNWEIQRKEKAQVEREKMSAELSFLKSQINPHFLFNSLNSIYALAEQQSMKTGDSILLLSNLMRYMLYSTNNGKIAIEKEINCIENYIALQRIRISSREDIFVHFDVKGDGSSIEIEPLILLPFVENAFKHGLSYNQRSEVTITISIEKNFVQLSVRNTKKPNQVSDKNGKTDSGIGLANIKRRLELLYPRRHELRIHDGNEYFDVYLKIQL